MLHTRTIEPRVAGKLARFAIASLALAVAIPSHAGTASPEGLVPSGFFVQLGLADEATAATAGLSWNPGWSLLPEPWTMSVEASVSRWRSRAGYPTDRGVLTQLALVPVVRHRLDQGRSPWFVEGGVGVTITSSLYRSGTTHFSTSFNFGSHIGAGYSFGAGRRDELALRLEHFSNAGIKHPNPGENFIQLRYVHRFD